jgi:hypothetical protein
MNAESERTTGGAVVHSASRRKVGQLARRRKRRKVSTGNEIKQLKLPFENYGRVVLSDNDDDETYRRNHFGYGRDD